ncbi:hypothetical protein [Agriterribacter sp.]|uniref:hypothetical protein n=1 Tax=Agriterribacter sp. TaxID=2821509 RepID=UPI002BB23334|nr:hypothetical protein [Agriterribacter sp.]HRP57163.1 hypothetical protein [Agriterribacter sp.]
MTESHIAGRIRSEGDQQAHPTLIRMENRLAKAACVFNVLRGIEACVRRVSAVTFLFPALYPNNATGCLPVQLPAFYHSYILLFACKPKNPV